MVTTRTRIAFVALFLTLFLWNGPQRVEAAGPVGDGAPSPAEIDALVRRIEDPAARKELIEELRILARTDRKPEPKSEVESAVAQVLAGISERIANCSEGVLQITGAVNGLPRLASWMRRQATEPEARAFWREVLLNMLVSLGAGFIVYSALRALFGRPRRAITAQTPGTVFGRLLALIAFFLLETLPIVGLLVVAYAVLGMVDPREKMRLGVVAFVNAFGVVRAAVALARVAFSPEAPALRLPSITDQTAHYLVIWATRIARVSVYGYFALQAALFFGIPAAAYTVLLRIVGLLLAVLVAILILQSRIPVTESIERRLSLSKRLRARTWLPRIAQLWWALAISYVFLAYFVWALEIQDGFAYLLRASFLTVAYLFLCRLVLRAAEALVGRGFAISNELQLRFPGLRERADRYFSGISVALRVVVYLLVSLAVLQAWGANVIGRVTSGPGRILFGSLVSVAVIMGLTVAAWEAINLLIEGYLAASERNGTAQSARTRTLLSVARKAVLIGLLAIAGMMVLSELGVNIAPLLAGAGMVGLAVGFGAQKLVQDVITGIFILIEDQIQVGDVVSAGDKSGLVEEVSIRTLRLRDVSGTVHTIPYSSITTVSNLTKGFSYYVFDVGVAYREDTDQVVEVLKQIGAELQNDPEFGVVILEPLEVLGVDSFADSAVVIKARFKTLPSKQWMVGREFNRRMKKKFDELEIEIPFPHTALYFGQDKAGKAPAARVRLEREDAGAPASRAGGEAPRSGVSAEGSRLEP